MFDDDVVYVFHAPILLSGWKYGREQLIKAALREHAGKVRHIPLHRQVIPWAMRSNVTAVHRADNWLEWRRVTVGARP